MADTPRGKALRGTVMIVDDSQVILHAARIALEKAGYSVVTVSNPIQVPVSIRQNQPDLVLLDVMMPALRGDQVLEIGKQFEYFRSALFVLHSTRPDDELEALAKKVGAAGFIPKIGSDILGFLRSVDEWMRKAKGRRG